MVNKFFALRKGKAEHVGFKAQAQGGELELQVYDVIGSDFFGEGITVANFSDAIKQAGDYQSIKLRINSPGGDVFEAVAIYNLLRSTGKPCNAVVEGLAASAASIIAMAGDKCTMGEGTLLMVHNAMMLAAGNADEMRKCADILDTVSGSIADIYASCTGMPKADVQKLMDAETWMDAQEAVDKGFADGIAKNSKAAVSASFNLGVYNNVPDSLKAAAPAKIAAEVSLNQRINDVQEALDEKYPAPPDDNAYFYYSGKYWAVEVYADNAIVCDNKDTDEYFRVTYTVNDADEVALGSTLEPVEKTWVPSATGKARISNRPTAAATDPIIDIFRKRLELLRNA